MKRHNEPIWRHPLSDSIDTGIEWNPGFEHWEAAVAAGATLDEIEKWENGGYSRNFMAKVIAWYRGHMLVKRHSDDAVSREMKKRSKKAGRK